MKTHLLFNLDFISFLKRHRFSFVVAIYTSLITIFLIISVLTPPPQKRVFAEKGYLDLTDWNFQTDGNVELSGELEFYWQKFITPNRIKPGSNGPKGKINYIQVPGTWNGYVANGQKLAGDGFATYRLTIALQNKDQILCVKVMPMSTAYELWVDGELIAFNGKIGKSAESMIPQYLNKSNYFKPKGKKVEVLLRVSNFMHRKGGIWRSILLGNHANIQRERDRKIAKDLVLSISLAIITFYHLAVFCQRKSERAVFYLAGFCMFVALRVLLIGERLLYTTLQNFSWEFIHKIEYLGLMMAMPLMGAYFHNLYPSEFKVRFLKIFIYISTFLMLIVIVTTADIYSWVIFPFEIASSIFFIYVVSVLIKAVANRRKNAGLILFSTIPIYIMGINDVLHVNHIIYTTELIHFGILFGALILTFILSQMVVEALESSEQLTIKLSKKNIILDKSNQEKDKHSRELEQQLFRSQKLEAIGSLSGGIAHDFNNILGTMQGYLEMLIDDKPDGNEDKTYLELVYQAGERATELVDQILTFSRTDETDFKPVRLQLIVNEVIKLIRSTLPMTIKIELEIDPYCRPILANETQIHQIIVNMCTNAQQAIGGKVGVLKIGLVEVMNELSQPLASGLQEGPYIQLTIEDDGCGMTDKVIERIFDPFFTTKEIGSGTGLGLSVVHGIIKNHSAEITVDSTMGKGTVFRVFFPAQEDTVSNKVDQMVQITGGKERILVVDDEVSLANFFHLALTSQGYQVVVLNTGVEAMEMIQSDPDSFDLVITDQAMPGMSGIQLGQRIKAIQPQKPVILITGYCNDSLQEQAVKTGIHVVLKKPIKIYQLAQAVRSELSKIADQSQNANERILNE